MDMKPPLKKSSASKSAMLPPLASEVAVGVFFLFVLFLAVCGGVAWVRFGGEGGVSSARCFAGAGAEFNQLRVLIGVHHVIPTRCMPRAVAGSGWLACWSKFRLWVGGNCV